jgi:hypothetical protein
MENSALTKYSANSFEFAHTKGVNLNRLQHAADLQFGDVDILETKIGHKNYPDLLQI